MTTIFSKIINREIPADIVYEDATVLAFLDIQPITKGHTLVIPKTASPDVLDADPETITQLMTVVQKIARTQRAVLGATGNNIIFNCGSDAGQEVFHTHAHVVPRFPADGAFAPPRHTAYEEDEATALARKLHDALSA